jgi:ABC-type transport system involved in multi-copper enzyme maturation permease subunit
MGRILAVAINTFREAVRDRVLYGVLGVATFVLLFTLVLAEVSLDQEQRIVLDVGLASISMFSVLASVFLGSSLLYKEIERKTLYVILPKPIQRYEFLLGKYVGIVLTVAVFIALQGAVQMCVTSLQAGVPLLNVALVVFGMPAVLGVLAWRVRDPALVVFPWSLAALGAATWVARGAEVDLMPVLASLMLTVGEIMMLTAVALFFSAFSTPFLTGLLTLGVWVAGRSADSMMTMKSRAIPEAVTAFLRDVVRFWPNFNVFVPGRHTLEVTLQQGAGPVSYVANTMLYAAAYSIVVLILAALVFRRRDFL